MRFFLINLLCLFFWVAEESAYAAKKYEINTENLPPEQQVLFLHAQQTLDDWSGEAYKLGKAKVLIDEVIEKNAGFLPAYIEKSRLIIMTGAMPGNDFKSANESALAILLDVQKKMPSYAKAYVLAGHVYTNIKDYKKAYEMLGLAEKLKAKDPWLYINFAVLMESLNQREKVAEYARKGLLAPDGTTKSIVAAAEYICKYSNAKDSHDASRVVADAVFAKINNADERLRIVERLIHGYRGRHQALDFASAILDRQSKETPDSPRVQLLFARLVISDGYMYTTNNVSRTDESALLSAEKILDGIKNPDELNTEIILLKVDIAMSRGRFDEARRLIAGVMINEINRDSVLYARANIEFSDDNFDGALKVLGEISKYNPGYAASIKASWFFYSDDKASLDAKNERYKRIIYNNPHDAWSLGNYASFLLYEMNDVDGAMKYGDLALKEMDYGNGRQTTSLAYLIKSSMEHKAGNLKNARKLYDRALLLGYSAESIKLRCNMYCDGVSKTIDYFKKTKK